MKNIIFDFGGVLLNIDYNLTVEAFKKLGVKDFDNVFTQFHQSSMAKDYEKGKISDDEFRDYIRKHSKNPRAIDMIEKIIKEEMPPNYNSINQENGIFLEKKRGRIICENLDEYETPPLKWVFCTLM